MPIYAILVGLVLLLAPVLPGVLGEDIWNQVFEALAFAALIAALVQKNVLIKPVTGAEEGPRDLSERLVLIFLGIAALSIASGLAMRHQGPAFLDNMLRGLTLFCAYGSIFFVCRRAAGDGTTARMIVLVCIVIGALSVSGDGVQNYLMQLRLNQGSWREFATFTNPDFLAGYLVITAPITLGLLFAAPRSPAFYLGFGLCFLLQLAAVVSTQSRFAVVSLAVSFVVFAAAAFRGRQINAVVSKKSMMQIGAAAVIFLAALSLVAKPLIARFAHPAQNSADFRVWTWRGTLHMILVHPILGSGVGSYEDTYPAFALTGFTRLAHNGYLQIAAECGIPALFVLMAFFGAVGGKAWGALESAGEDGPWNRRFILGGAIAALAGGLIQNLIDSDVYILPCGILLFAVAGMCSGASSVPVVEEAQEPLKPERNSRRSRRSPAPALEPVPEKRPPGSYVIVFAALVLALYAGANAVGAWYGEQAQTAIAAGDAPGAVADYQSAMQFSPLNATYPSDLGYKVTAEGQNNMALAETQLRQAASLEPGDVPYIRLSDILAAEGKLPDADAALDSGLALSPNSLDLLARRAEYSAPSDKINWYRKISDLEMTPVGQVRAIGLTEPRFAIGDAFLEDAAYKSGDYPTAIIYGKRAISLLSAYFDEGGGNNSNRVALSPFNPAQEEIYKNILARSTQQLTASQKAVAVPVAITAPAAVNTLPR